MEPVTQPDNIYWAPVDPEAPNNSHAHALRMVGANKRVLELGPAAGAFTRALVDKGCRVVGVEVDPAAARSLEGVAERVIVGDVSSSEVVASAIDEERYDVVVAGDVLEHLADPLRVLRACRAALKPGGYAVLSLPNIAHADVKLQLLAGRFAYRDTGLLDRTHLHFFTLESMHELVRDAGMLVIDLERVVVPVFHTEQAPDPASVAPAVLEEAMADPEAETYQFVVRAVVHDGDAEVAELARRAIDLHTEAERARARAAGLEAEIDRLRDEVGTWERLHEEAVAHARGFEALSEDRRRQVEAIQATRSYRMLGPLRRVFARR